MQPCPLRSVRTLQGKLSQLNRKVRVLSGDIHRLTGAWKASMEAGMKAEAHLMGKESEAQSLSEALATVQESRDALQVIDAGAFALGSNL